MAGKRGGHGKGQKRQRSPKQKKPKTQERVNTAEHVNIVIASLRAHLRNMPEVRSGTVSGVVGVPHKDLATVRRRSKLSAKHFNAAMELGKTQGRIRKVEGKYMT